MSKTLRNMEDDTWKHKGHTHDEKVDTPAVCPHCMGTGKGTGNINPYTGKEEQSCFLCDGEGMVYDL